MMLSWPALSRCASIAVEDEGDGLEAAVRMRPEGQAAVVRRVGLRAVVVQEQEGIDLFQVGLGTGRWVIRSPMSSRSAGCASGSMAAQYGQE
jgi:hypothetical protein